MGIKWLKFSRISQFSNVFSSTIHHRRFNEYVFIFICVSFSIYSSLNIFEIVRKNNTMPLAFATPSRPIPSKSFTAVTIFWPLLLFHIWHMEYRILYYYFLGRFTCRIEIVLVFEWIILLCYYYYMSSMFIVGRQLTTHIIAYRTE